MYRYETHMHTLPVSKCARADVRTNVAFYHSLGYAGIFITNHFLDGNIDIDRSLPYQEKLDFYFKDLEDAKAEGARLGLQVLGGVELSYKGTDFLIYGPDKDWYKAHPEIMDLKKSEELSLLMDSGALVIQAHPYREAAYIDHIRLFPRHVHGVEVLNTSCKDEVNAMGKLYAQSYGLLPFAGSDNHSAAQRQHFAGLEFESPLEDEWDFVHRVKNGDYGIFQWKTDV